jgi:hypothetical protein
LKSIFVCDGTPSERQQNNGLQPGTKPAFHAMFVSQIFNFFFFFFNGDSRHMTHLSFEVSVNFK